MNTERFRTNVFLSALLLALGLCVALFWPFWRAVAWAVVLAILIFPTHRRVVAKVGNPVVAAGLSTILTVALIVVPLALLALAVKAEGDNAVMQTRAIIQNETWRQWMPQAKAGPLSGLWGWLGQYVDLSPENMDTMAHQGLERATGILTNAAAGFFRNVATTFVQVGLALVTLFFILKDGSRLLPAVKAFIPLDEDQTDVVLSRAVGAMYAAFYGIVLVAMLQGTLGGLMFWWLGLPSPLLWGAVMTMLCIVPLAGAPIVWVPAVAILALNGAWAKAIILGLWGWLVVGTVDNITRPLIIGGRTSLHPLAVFFSILGGLLALGSVGVFLGPVLLSVTLALLDILRLKLGHAPPPSGPPSPPSSGGEAPAKSAASSTPLGVRGAPTPRTAAP